MVSEIMDYLTVYRKFVLLALCEGIHMWWVDSSHKGLSCRQWRCLDVTIFLDDYWMHEAVVLYAHLSIYFIFVLNSYHKISLNGSFQASSNNGNRWSLKTDFITISQIPWTKVMFTLKLFSMLAIIDPFWRQPAYGCFHILGALYLMSI